jgi:hypothetical protein
MQEDSRENLSIKVNFAAIVRRAAVGAALAGALALVASLAAAQTRKEPPRIGDPPEAMNLRLVGYNDVQGRTAYQPTIFKQGGRYIAYIGHQGGAGEFAKPLNPQQRCGMIGGQQRCRTP